MANWTKQARLALSQKDYLQAGDFFKLDGSYRKAIKAYLKGDHLIPAAKLQEELGDLNKAEKLYLKHGASPELAAFYQRMDKVDAAVEVLIKIGNKFDAAELLEKMQRLPQAALLYEQLGFFERSGILYGKAKMAQKAIEMFQKASVKLEREDSVGSKAAILKYKDWIANLYIATRRFQEAGNLFMELNRLEPAAKCFLKAGQPIRAAELFAKLGQTEQARQILESRPSAEGQRVLGKIALEEGRFADAIRLLKGSTQHEILSKALEKTGQYLEAAQELEKCGEHHRAAEMYAKGRDYKRAAQLFKAHNYYKDAAINYEIIQDFEMAASMYQLAKDTFKTGFCLFKCNEFDEALMYLQELDEGHPNELEAQRIKGQIFFLKKEYDVAKRTLEDLITKSQVDAENIDVLYLLARSFEGDQDIPSAMNYYRKVYEKKVAYRDVKKRMDRLNSMMKRSNTSTTATQVTMPSPDVTISEKIGVGDVIANRFRIDSEIGKGGMGFIYRCRDLVLERDIALKMLIEKQGDLSELKTELITARDLTHPYIIKVFDIGQWHTLFYFTMELVKGQSLKAYIQRQSRGNIMTDLKIMAKICEGLSAAHKQGVVHRDIKPQNILLDANLNPKILDFGIAKKYNQAVKEKTISGSPKYMAPEQIQNKGCDPRTDIYSIGIVMFYLFTKTEPFTGENAIKVLQKQLTQPLPNPFEVNSDLPYWLCSIIVRCAQKNPDLRYQNMEELIEEIKLNLTDLKL